MQTQTDEKLYTPREAMPLLGFRSTKYHASVLNLIKAGKLDAIKLNGRTIRIPQSAIDKYLADKKVAKQRPSPAEITARLEADVDILWRLTAVSFAERGEELTAQDLLCGVIETYLHDGLTVTADLLVQVASKSAIGLGADGAFAAVVKDDRFAIEAGCIVYGKDPE